MVIELLAGAMRRGCDGIAAVEDDMRQTYTVKHIRKGLTLLSSMKSPWESWRNCRGGKFVHWGGPHGRP